MANAIPSRGPQPDELSPYEQPHPEPLPARLRLQSNVERLNALVRQLGGGPDPSQLALVGLVARRIQLLSGILSDQA